MKEGSIGWGGEDRNKGEKNTEEEVGKERREMVE